MMHRGLALVVARGSASRIGKAVRLPSSQPRWSSERCTATASAQQTTSTLGVSPSPPKQASAGPATTQSPLPSSAVPPKPKPIVNAKPHISEGQFATVFTHSGHSSILGPIVVAAVGFDAKGAKTLIEAGIARHQPVDKRDAMYDLIIQNAKFCKVAEISSEKFNDLTLIDKIKPQTIIFKQYHDLADELVSHHKNELGTVYVRSGPSRPSEMFKEKFAKDFQVSTEPGWLERAAYLVARTRRDRQLEAIKNVHKEAAGSGFPTDWRTREWLRIHMKRKRKQHPVNMIKYVGWNEDKLLSDWKAIEKKRWEEQRQSYFSRYPQMVNDPVRLTGTFEQYRAMEAELKARMREIQSTQVEEKKAAKQAKKEKREARELKRKSKRNALLKVYTAKGSGGGGG